MGHSPKERTPELIERIFWCTYRGNTSYTLNPAQWAALRYFASEHEGKRTSSEFAKFHHTTRGTANQTVLALIRRGYLQREIAPNDHRSKSVRLTQAGEAVLKADPTILLAKAVADFDAAERQRFERQLEVLYERIKHLQSHD